MGIFVDSISEFFIEIPEEGKGESEYRQAIEKLTAISKEYNTVDKPWKIISEEIIKYNTESRYGFIETFEELKEIVSRLRDEEFDVYGEVFMIDQDNTQVELFKVALKQLPERHVAVFERH